MAQRHPGSTIATGLSSLWTGIFTPSGILGYGLNFFLASHVHRREDEVFVVLEGDYEFFVGGRTLRAGGGSVVYGPRDVPHSFKNVGTTPARMLAFVAPAGFQGFLEEVGKEATEGFPPPKPGREEIERMLAAAPKYGIEMLPPPA